MVKDITKYNIEIFRGDTFEAKLNISGYELGENDVIKYSVKKSTKMNTPVVFEHTIEKPFDDIYLVFKHSDTSELDDGVYYYDVQLTINAEDEPIIKTILYGELKIKGDVTE